MNLGGTSIAGQESEAPVGQSSMPERKNDFIIGRDDRILVTGATGFVGSRAVASLLDRGFRNLVCFARHSSEPVGIDGLAGCRTDGVRIEALIRNQKLETMFDWVPSVHSVAGSRRHFQACWRDVRHA